MIPLHSCEPLSMHKCTQQDPESSIQSCPIPSRANRSPTAISIGDKWKWSLFFTPETCRKLYARAAKVMKNMFGPQITATNHDYSQ